jgi:hypothetical protein
LAPTYHHLELAVSQRLQAQSPYGQELLPYLAQSIKLLKDCQYKVSKPNASEIFL